MPTISAYWKRALLVKPSIFAVFATLTLVLMTHSAMAQSISRQLDRAAACVVVARTLSASGRLPSDQAAQAAAIYQAALGVQNSEFRALSSAQASQVKSYYSDKLTRPVRILAALNRTESTAALLAMCAEFG